MTTHSTPTLQNALTIAVPLYPKAGTSIRQSQWHERAYRYIIRVMLLIQKSSDSWVIWHKHIIIKRAKDADREVSVVLLFTYFSNAAIGAVY